MPMGSSPQVHPSPGNLGQNTSSNTNTSLSSTSGGNKSSNLVSCADFGFSFKIIFCLKVSLWIIFK